MTQRFPFVAVESQTEVTVKMCVEGQRDEFAACFHVCRGEKT